PRASAEEHSSGQTECVAEIRHIAWRQVEPDSHPSPRVANRSFGFRAQIDRPHGHVTRLVEVLHPARTYARQTGHQQFRMCADRVDVESSVAPVLVGLETLSRSRPKVDFLVEQADQNGSRVHLKMSTDVGRADAASP